MVPVADYASPGGTATVYKPDPSNPQALTDLLASTVSGVKSCTFALVDGLTVDLTQLGQVQVLIENQSVPQDASNGWSMIDASHLLLSGTACDLWHQPTSHSIDFRFPCGVVRGN